MWGITVISLAFVKITHALHARVTSAVRVPRLPSPWQRVQHESVTCADLHCRHCPLCFPVSLMSQFSVFPDDNVVKMVKWNSFLLRATDVLPSKTNQKHKIEWIQPFGSKLRMRVISVYFFLFHDRKDIHMRLMIIWIQIMVSPWFQTGRINCEQMTTFSTARTLDSTLFYTERGDGAASRSGSACLFSFIWFWWTD